MVPTLTPALGVILDFYGTLGESSWTGNWLEETLAAQGYRVDQEAGRRFTPDAWDGEEHDEHSQSRDHYTAWLRSRWVELLVSAGVPDAEHRDVLAAIDRRRAEWEMELYPEALDVLRVLRERGLRLVLCSNWDWDLDTHVAKLGLDALVDHVVCSAWIGARKPHPRVFRAALEVAGLEPDEAVFVGDNVVADVEGALAAGIPAVHVWRGAGEAPPLPEGATRITDLRGLLPLVDVT